MSFFTDLIKVVTTITEGMEAAETSNVHIDEAKLASQQAVMQKDEAQPAAKHVEANKKATFDMQEKRTQNEKVLLSVFALGLYLARLDGEADQELDYIESCLADADLSSEAVMQEIDRIYQKKQSFLEIRMKYLDKISVAELEYVDSVIKGVIEADGQISEKEQRFYNNTWLPYVRKVKGV